jgi:ATPase subunit of ABC transporter with duplicated ATPase domains
MLGSKFLDALDTDRRQKAEVIMSFSARVAAEREEIKQAVSENPLIIQAHELFQKLQLKRPDLSLRIKDGYFKFTEQLNQSQARESAKQRIETVYNGAPVQGLVQMLMRLISCKKGSLETIELFPMKDVNLYFEQGKTYLVLGGPRSGKSTLLRMIAGILPEDKDHQVGGTVTINKFDTKSKGLVWSNIVGYVQCSVVTILSNLFFN